VLGPVEAWSDGQRLTPGGDMQRTLLALLALRANEVVPADRLMAALWPQGPPASARARLHDQVFALRRVLRRGGPTAADCLVTRPPGYTLHADPDRIDHLRFATLVRKGRRARADGDPAAAVEHLRTALALWRGPALGGVDGDGLAGEAQRLEEARLAAVEECVDAELDRGAADDVIPELTALVAEHPLRERLRGQLMLALYRVGRQAEALDVWQDARRHLRDDLGLDPGPELLALRDRVLRNDESLLARPPYRASVGPVSAPKESAARPAGTDPPAFMPQELPADILGFVGRAPALGLLDYMLSNGRDDDGTAMRIAVVSGTAGVGKTTLAVHWAHRAADRFPDGQLFVNLRGFATDAPVEPVEALGRFLRALGRPGEQVPVDEAEAAALFRSMTAGRRMLVLLDNARDADQVRPLLPGSPSCVVVVTSRNRLVSLIAAEAAVPVGVDVFADVEARTLLTRRLGVERVAEPDAVDALVGHCAGLPLALVLVAAGAAARPEYPLAAVARDVAESQDRLEPFADDTVTTDVRAVFHSSYRLLSQPAARLFRMLALHTGAEASTHAAASLVDAPLDAVRRWLGECTAAHLLSEPAPGRYTCHDLLKAYAAMLGRSIDPAAERQAAVRRLFDHYVHTGHRAAMLYERRPPLPLDDLGPDPAPEDFTDREEAVSWLKAEYPALLGAVDQAAAAGLASHAWRLTWVVNIYLDRNGHWHEALAAHRSALTATRLVADPVAELRVLRGIGFCFVRVGRYDDARAHLNEALDRSADLDDHASMANIHRALAWMYHRQHRLPETVSHLEQAIDHCRTAGDRAGHADALRSLGECQSQLGQHREALATCRRALAELQDADYPWGEAQAWRTLGEIHRALGEHGESVESYGRAVQLFADGGDRYNEAVALIGLGDSHTVAGDDVAARQALRRALAILDDIDHSEADAVRARLRDA
jgi:DNA-binding SARP family transcriptional activator/tetratricopeptide (TPR) repeat protein